MYKLVWLSSVWLTRENYSIPDVAIIYINKRNKTYCVLLKTHQNPKHINRFWSYFSLTYSILFKQSNITNGNRYFRELRYKQPCVRVFVFKRIRIEWMVQIFLSRGLLIIMKLKRDKPHILFSTTRLFSVLKDDDSQDIRRAWKIKNSMRNVNKGKHKQK